MTEATRLAAGATCLVLGLGDLVFMNTVVLPRALPGRARSAPVLVATVGNAATSTAAIAVRPQPAVETGPAPAIEPAIEPTLMPAHVPETPVLAPAAVYFPTAAARLDRAARRSLDRMVSRLAALSKKTRAPSVIVEGHADVRGDDSFNDRLSHQRALAVSARLKAHGVAPSRIVVRRFGATRPAATGGDPESLRLNRRVEIIFGGGKP